MHQVKMDLRDYRQALGAFLTGVTVVTISDQQGNPRGFTANSFTSVSLDPPLVLVCISKRAGSFQAFAVSDGFAVNILSEDQEDLARVFATPVSDRFSNVDWRSGPAGHPVFDNAAAWLDCRRHDYVDAGDHVIMIGRTVGFAHRVQPPLGYSRGTYVSAGLERRALSQGHRSTEILAILEREEAVLLVGGDYSPLSLPQAATVGSAVDPASLLGRLAAAGVEAELGFVFSVVDNAESDCLRIIYRGTAETGVAGDPKYRFYGLKEIPWQRLDSPATQTALRRYTQERLEYRFGIYVGGAETGQIAELTSAPRPSSNDDIDAGASPSKTGTHA